MNKRFFVFIVPAIAIIAAETVCTLCNVCDYNTLVSGSHSMPASGNHDTLAPGNQMQGDNTVAEVQQDDANNATGWNLWRIR